MRVVRAAEREYVAASHENPERPGVYKRVLATHDQLLQGRIQMINWARLPVGASFQAHYHEDMEETFVMIDGEARMEVGSAAVELRRGDAITARRWSSTAVGPPVSQIAGRRCAHGAADSSCDATRMSTSSRA